MSRLLKRGREGRQRRAAERMKKQVTQQRKKVDALQSKIDGDSPQDQRDVLARERLRLERIREALANTLSKLS